MVWEWASKAERRGENEFEKEENEMGIEHAADDPSFYFHLLLSLLASTSPASSTSTPVLINLLACSDRLPSPLSLPITFPSSLFSSAFPPFLPPPALPPAIHLFHRHSLKSSSALHFCTLSKHTYLSSALIPDSSKRSVSFLFPQHLIRFSDI